MHSVNRFYQGDAGRRYQDEKRGIPAAAFPWVARLRARKLQPFIQAHHVVFEFGVGWGWNLAALHCRRRLGYDVAEFLGPALTQHQIEAVSDLEQIPDGSIDVAICHHTLEHVARPLDTLARLAELLAGEGRLVVCVPFEKERRYRRFWREEPNHHLFSWNAQTLGNLVEAAGLRVEGARLALFGYDRFAAHWSVKLGWGEIGFRWLRGCLHLLRPSEEVRLVSRREPAP